MYLKKYGTILASVNHMEFDYGEYFKELKNDPNKRDVALRYERVFGLQENLTIEDQAFYKNYLSWFSFPFPIAIPKDCPNDYDWGLIIRFIFGSFSTDYDFILDEDWKKRPKGLPTIHLAIYASTESKMLDELFDLQVLYILKAYLFEQMKISLVMEEELDEFEGEEPNMKIGLVYQYDFYKYKKSLMLKTIKSIRKKNAVH